MKLSWRALLPAVITVLLGSSVALPMSAAHADETVELPSLALTGGAVAPSAFYPLVKDGYRDIAFVSFRPSIDSRVWITVTDSAHKVVRTWYDGFNMGGGNSWYWDGRRNDGTKVAPGRYTMTVAARALDFPDTGDAPQEYGPTLKVSGTVTVATGWREKRQTKTIAARYAHRTHSRSCYADYAGYLRAAMLDCWGGSFAQARYVFTIPADAHSLHLTMGGTHRSLDDIRSGRITKTASRIDKRHYMVTLRATGWRAYQTSWARLDYTAKARI